MRSDDVPALTFVPPEVFESTWRSAKGTPEERAAAFADLARSIRRVRADLLDGAAGLGCGFLSTLERVGEVVVDDVLGDEGDVRSRYCRR